MSIELTLSVDRRPDGEVVLNAAGEIDMSNAGDFSAALADARREAAEQVVVVDLTRLEYIDSAGLAVLFPHVEHLRLVATPLLAPLLTVAGLDDLTTVHDG